MKPFAARRLSGILLIVSFALHMGGVLVFNATHTIGWFVETTTLLRWERGLFVAAYASPATSPTASTVTGPS